MRLVGATAMLLAIAVSVSVFAAEIGDVERGAELWADCQSCHMVGADAEIRTGPPLNDVFGRKAGTVKGFAYSKAMQRASADGLVWTPDTLDIYIENPKSLVTGTAMQFQGIEDAQDRLDLLAFLRLHSVSPADIPESAATAIARDPDVDPAILAIEGDKEYGAYLASECVACHQAGGSDEGIPSIVGWRKDDFVIAMHAYKNEARPHPVMRMIAGRLSGEEIASLAVYFGEKN